MARRQFELWHLFAVVALFGAAFMLLCHVPVPNPPRTVWHIAYFLAVRIGGLVLIGAGLGIPFGKRASIAGAIIVPAVVAVLGTTDTI